MLDEIKKELCQLVKSRGVNQDSCIGIILTLKTEEKYLKLIKWIEQNENAGQTEILRHMDLIVMSETEKEIPYFIMPPLQNQNIYPM